MNAVILESPLLQKIRFTRLLSPTLAAIDKVKLKIEKNQTSLNVWRIFETFRQDYTRLDKIRQTLMFV